MNNKQNAPGSYNPLGQGYEQPERNTHHSHYTIQHKEKQSQNTVSANVVRLPLLLPPLPDPIPIRVSYPQTPGNMPQIQGNVPPQSCVPSRLVCLNDVQIEPVTWLWEDRIPYGKVTILMGDPDIGKTFQYAVLSSFHPLTFAAWLNIVQICIM